MFCWRVMTIYRLTQLVTYQRLVGQESSYYVLLFQPMDSHSSPTEHNMMIPDQQVFDK
jgi:hypothetical protein